MLLFDVDSNARRLPAVAAVVAGANDLLNLDAATLAAIDVLEIRADMFPDADGRMVQDAMRRARALGKKILLTVRRSDEGGAVSMTEEDRQYLYLALLEDCDAIDVEIASTSLWNSVAPVARQKGRTVIGSCHRFDLAPDDEWIEERFQTARQFGADVFKLAAMLHGSHDLIRLLSFTERHAADRVIVLGMGPWGLVSRVAAPVLGSLMTYGFLSRSSAPGQLPVAELARLLRQLHPDFQG